MTTDYRTLCAELVDALHNAIRVIYREDGTKHISTAEPILDRARAALATEPEEPSDAELLELMPETLRDEFSYAASACSDATGAQVKPGIFRVCLNTAALEYARAVLARYGHQPTPPADEEVGEVIGLFRRWADAYPDGVIVDPQWLTRAAELLSQ